MFLHITGLSTASFISSLFNQWMSLTHKLIHRIKHLPLLLRAAVAFILKEHIAITVYFDTDEQSPSSLFCLVWLFLLLCPVFIISGECMCVGCDEVIPPPRTGLRVLTSPSSPGLSEVTARSLPLSSKALMSIPQLVCGCLNQFCSTCLKSMLCQWPTLELSSIFSERMRMWRLPCSVTGFSRRICR